MWLQPTLNRVEKLKNFIESAIAAETTTPGLLLIDHQDWAFNEKAYKELPLIPGWQFRLTKGVTMGEKVREVWHEVEHRNWVGILNDDHHIVTKHWDLKMLNKLDGKNFVSANDRWVAPRKATTATLWSMDLLKCLGWPIFPPGLHHLYIDDLWENLGRQTGCWRPIMSVVVEHHHVYAGRAEEDDTHRKVYSQKAWDTDTATFQNFMKHDFEAAVAKIKVFQDKLPGQRYKPPGRICTFEPDI